MKLSMDDMTKLEVARRQEKEQMTLGMYHAIKEIAIKAEANLKTYRELLNKVKAANNKEEAVGIVEKLVEQKVEELKKIEEEERKLKKQLELAKQDRQVGEIEDFAKTYNLKFGDNKEKLVDTIFKKNGYCPCKREEKWENICPCKDALREIVRNGKCICGLFVMPETMKKTIEPIKHLDVELEDAIKLGKMVVDKDIEKMLGLGKVTILDFYAEWCGPCRRLGEVLEKIKDEDVVVKRIDVDKDAGLSDRFCINAVPFVAVFDKNGKPFSAFSGCRDEEYLKNVISRARKS